MGVWDEMLFAQDLCCFYFKILGDDLLADSLFV